jgi:hypothetical protein
MIDTRDEDEEQKQEQRQRWRERRETRSRWIPRSNRTILYDTGKILYIIFRRYL